MVLVEGVFALGAGALLLIWTQESGRVLLWVVGGFLLLNSALWVYAGLRPPAASGETPPPSPIKLVRGGIGLIVGLLVVIQPFIEYITAEAALIVLALGLIIVGLLGVYEAFVIRTEGRGSAVLIAALTLALGALLIVATVTDITVIRWIGYAALTFGVLLVGYGVLLYRQQHQVVGSTGTPPAPQPQ
jgi:uncharacterized membrane protein HdeD (DUF308 family)